MLNRVSKKFVYQVTGFEWEDSEAFGWAWRQAKAKATELHAAVYRLIIKGDEEPRQEVYYKGGCFNSIRFATEDNVKITRSSRFAFLFIRPRAPGPHARFFGCRSSVG